MSNNKTPNGKMSNPLIFPKASQDAKILLYSLITLFIKS